MPESDKVDIGDLNKRVTYQTKTSTRSFTSAGQKIDTWDEGTEYWAKVEPLSGRELWTARQLQASTTHRITMRNVGVAIKSPNRFVLTDPVFGTRYLYVESVYRIDELNEFLRIEVSEPKDHA
jgi:head-tail adaptor